jgi:peptidoglycan/xylan/chitin deacetylase (PgdA/CDA1 family)
MGSIFTRYGFTSERFNRTMVLFQNLLRRYNCRATFPITITALSRNIELIKEYQANGIEFAVHGYRHIDLSNRSLDKQFAELSKCQEVLSKAEIDAMGFRGPYLRWNSDTRAVLRDKGLIYDSSLPIAWPISSDFDSDSYNRALKFYRSVSAEEYPSLPDIEDGLVIIPYSLPDDEAMVERLSVNDANQMSEMWLQILRQTYRRGELFTIGLHPERFVECEQPLEEVLKMARELNPEVWIARLDEIAIWWLERYQADITISTFNGSTHISMTGPKGCTFHARAIETELPTVPFVNGYRIVAEKEISISNSCRPFIGISPDTSPALYDFLRQQGYIVEISDKEEEFTFFIDQSEFTSGDKISLVNKIEQSQSPLLRFGRWPYGARSALAITGDIDALTYWDYGLRFFGR